MGKPVTYIGAEAGFPVIIGLEMARRLGRNHPTTEAFYQFRRLNEVVEGRENEGPILRRNMGWPRQSGTKR